MTANFPTPLRLLLLGDVMLARGVEAALDSHGPAWVWGDLLALLASADLRILNLECVLARGGERWAPGVKGHHFRARPDRVATLTAAGVSAVALANNHTGDFGPQALVETLDVLDAAGISHAGAGRNEADAWRPAYVESGGRRVALVACTDNERQWGARGERPGTAAARADLADPRAQRLLRVVREARREADLVVVSLHWGGNWGSVPPPSHPPFARALVDAGADVVHGHSPHELRGIGVHENRPILYSCGDFVDDYGARPGQWNDRGAVFVVEVEGSRPVRVRCRPTVIRDAQARLATGSLAIEIGARLVASSTALGSVARWDRAAVDVVIDL